MLPRIYVVIPAHNEGRFIKSCLDSLAGQTLMPRKAVVVCDHCTDDTPSIVEAHTRRHGFISCIERRSEDAHLPGGKVIKAFYDGLGRLDDDYDFLVKLDADIVLPADYFEKVVEAFHQNPNAGIVGGYAYEQDAQGAWKKNHPMGARHVRGAFKTYSKACFHRIGGLRPAMGWDTLDELLAAAHGFETVALERLKVKHLRPLAQGYHPKTKEWQGEAMYAIGYSPLIAALASLKMAYKQGKARLFIDCLKGYAKALWQGKAKLVTADEQKFIRKYRYKLMRQKLKSLLSGAQLR